MAAVEHPLRMRLQVGSLGEAARLGVDLHWSTRRREPRGYLSGVDALEVPAEGGVFIVDLPVRFGRSSALFTASFTWGHQAGGRTVSSRRRPNR
jgi:hypothetical protein